MVLNELPTNHIGRNGAPKQAQQAPSKLTSQSSSANGTNPSSSLNNSAIKSMMRNGTETGNVGQFSVKPSHRASPMSGASAGPFLRSRKGSKNQSQPLQYPHQGPYNGHGRHTPVSRHEAAPPSPSRQLSSPVSYRGSPRGPSVEEYRSYSMTQSSYVTHSLANRHPYITAAHHQQQTRRNLQNVRPRSPFAYPTRLKRPGYRPSSPALSDLNRPTPESDLDRGQSSRTASPASMYNMNRVPTPWQQVVNRSDPMLRYYPPTQGAHSSIASTPKPVPSLRSVASSSRLSQIQPSWPGAWPPSQTPTPPPLFYDYTEAFEETTHTQRVSVISSPHIANPRVGQSPYLEHDASPEIDYPIELPTETPFPVIDRNTLAPEARHSLLVAHHHIVEVEPRAQETQQAPEAPDLSSFTVEVAHDLPATSSISHVDGKVETRRSLQHALNAPQTPPQAVKSQKEEIRRRPVNSKASHTTPKKPQHTDHVSSSPTDSVCSAEASHLEHLSDSTAPTSGADTVTASPEGPPRIPVIGTHHSGPIRHITGRRLSEASRISAADTITRNDYPEIVAPTPERSITSLSNRDRFSKILGLDEGLLELDGLTALSYRRRSKANYAASPILTTHGRLQDSMSPPATNDHTIAEETDSDNEHELTNGLMETFGRSNNLETHDELSANLTTTVPTEPPEDSAIPPINLKLPPVQTPSKRDLRISHRKTVVVRGQKCESTVSPFALSAQEKKADVDKGLPITSNPSPLIKAFAPLNNACKVDLPFAFTPLIQPPSEDDSMVELETISSSYLNTSDSQSQIGKNVELPLQKPRPRLSRLSTASPPGSRPWNNAANYPWDDEPPKLDVRMPLPEKEPPTSTEKYPKFRLRIHRASSSTGGTKKLVKKRHSSEDTTSSRIASSIDLIKTASFRRTGRPNLHVAPGQENSSHDVMGTSPMQTRFVETFDRSSPPLASPAITLLPPSPGIEVRSFFSDDSSQARPKGTLRKRFSDFRARNSRANSVDSPGYDRGLLNSAFGISRTSGRSSRQSQNTAGDTSYGSRRRGRWNLFARFRSWLMRRDDKVRDWKWKKRNRGQVRDGSTQLYAGV